MKIGLVGAGRFGKNHVRTLHEMGVLAGVAELDAETRAAAAEQTGVRAVADYRELLQQMDAFVVATPVHTHFAIAREILLAGKPVMVEKPITLSVSEAEELVELARGKGLPLMVGHLLIFQPAIRWIKEAVEAGMIGDVVSVHQERLNLGKARANENALWSLGVHDVAVLLYLFGSNPTEVSFVGQSFLTGGVEDDTYLHLEFQGGKRGHVHNSWLWPETRRVLHIVGSEGMLVFNEATRQVIHHKKSIDSGLNNVDLGSELVFEGESQPLKLELEHFVQCVQTGNEPITSGASAIEVLKVLEAARAS